MKLLEDHEAMLTAVRDRGAQPRGRHVHVERHHVDAVVGAHHDVVADGAETELDYGPGGLLTRVLDSTGEEHTFTYDAEGRLTSP